MDRRPDPWYHADTDSVRPPRLKFRLTGGNENEHWRRDPVVQTGTESDAGESGGTALRVPAGREPMGDGSLTYLRIPPLQPHAYDTSISYLEVYYEHERNPIQTARRFPDPRPHPETAGIARQVWAATVAVPEGVSPDPLQQAPAVGTALRPLRRNRIGSGRYARLAGDAACGAERRDGTAQGGESDGVGEADESVPEHGGGGGAGRLDILVRLPE